MNTLAARLSQLARGLAGRSQRRGPVAMLHYGRCGSSVLADLIGRHPRVYWDEEVFRRMLRKTCLEARFIGDPFRLLRVRMMRAAGRCYGFETKCHEAYDLGAPMLNMSIERLLDILIEEMGYRRFIVLKRRNYLRQQISVEVGRQVKRWHHPAGASPRLHPITLDLDRVGFGWEDLPLLDSFAERDRGYDRIARRLDGQRVLRLTFEDDVLPDPLRGYRRVCDFLDLVPGRPEVQRARTNPFALRELLNNYDEVAAALRSTSYAWMLEDEPGVQQKRT
jgi:hypothetical protein